MARMLLLVAGLAVASTLAHNSAHSEDDFAFDNNDEFQIDISGSSESVKSSQSLRRLWGVPDTSAYVGRLFRLEIPKEAFSGEVSAYKVSSPNKQPLPSWLALDSKHGILTGVAALGDVGSHTLTVSAHGKDARRKAEDTFTVEVRRDLEKPLVANEGARCLAGEDELILVIVLDRPFLHIKPKQKIKALMSLSSFMGIDGEAFSMDAYNLHDSPNTNYTVFLSGPGNAKKTLNQQSSAIFLNVGCSGKLWPAHKILVHQLREQARDGSVSDLIHLPVLAWKVVTKSHKPDPRLKRQAEEGSAYYDPDDDQDGDDYSGYDDDDDYENFATGDELPEVDPAIPLPRTTSSTAAPTTTSTSIRTPLSTPATHPHRHHHGEPNYPDMSREDVFSNTESDIFVAVETTPHIPIVNTTLVKSVDVFTTTDIPVVTTAVEVETTELPPEMFTAQITVETNEYQSNKNENPVKATVTAHIPSSTHTFPPTPSTTTPRPSEDTTPFATAITTNAIVRKNMPVEIVPANGHGLDNETDIEKSFKESRKKNVLHRNSPVQIVPEETTSAETTMQSTLLIEPSILPSEPSTVVTPRPASVATTTEKVRTPSTLTPTLASIPTTTPTPAPPPPPPSPATPPTQLVETNTEQRTTTEQEALLPTERSSTILGVATETIDFRFPTNSPPTLNHRMKKIAVTAGKAFRYIIPEDLFTDVEDGSALSLAMYDSDKAALPADSWVQFLPDVREVYGLPLEEHVSKWEYIVEARDSKGARAADRLDVTVQQHKGRRAVNHEFSVKMKVIQKYPAAVNWQIRALEGLVNLFGDEDMNQITVREVGRDNELVEFVWTNDTLPKNECPTNEINRLLNILRADESGSPSSALSDAMAPELKAREVGWRALGVCQTVPTPPAAPAPPRQPDNFPPVPRNQVDHIVATVGHLLVFKVPEDTFFDPEDGGSRSLALRVVRGDRSPLPPQHWLQFDNNNQEFYGLPTERDVGKKDYQLIAEDSGGKTANDGLIVEVNAASPIRPNVEFSVTLDSPLATLVSSAKMKRQLLEKMQRLFYDEDASSIRVKSITDNPTTIVWYNTSLPTDGCPNREIQELRKILLREDGYLTSRVDEIMGADFPVMSVSVNTTGACAGHDALLYNHELPRPPPAAPPTTHTEAAAGRVDDYLITFIIPAVVVVCMIVVAGIIACVLYRRRKTGKMSLGDEEERQAFRSKGIPVIFQDELDEKPDPSNKSPVIMKEEKPPLLPPPSYGGADSPAPSPRAPYHPPPPFPPNRESARNSRAKATPTYRKPPPYVPP